MKFWLEGRRRAGLARRKVKRRKRIGAERKYSWGLEKWTSLVHLRDGFRYAECAFEG